MEQSINIAALLKDCPRGTKLYSPICGECELFNVTSNTDERIYVKYHEITVTFDKDGRMDFGNGECLLFPSKEVRDWGLWKAKYVRGREEDENNQEELRYYFLNLGGKINPRTFINFTSGVGYIYLINQITGYIEQYHEDSEKGQYILSTGTELKLEEQPKFKVGDVVVDTDENKLYMVINGQGEHSRKIGWYSIDCTLANACSDPDVGSNNLRLATPEEIAKWDEEVLQSKHLHYSKSKRKIIDWFKEFDKVVVRCDKDSKWTTDSFSYYDKGYFDMPFVCGHEHWKKCLPYNEKTAKLIGTTDDWKEE